MSSPMYGGVGDTISSPADVLILTASKSRIPAHSRVLAAASPVLERLLDQTEKRIDGSGGAISISILGVPHGAVDAFLRFLYSPSRCGMLEAKGEEAAAEMAEHAVHLLVLSHVYQVGWLKRACERALASRLASEAVVDVLVLARRCDAAWLHLRCMKLIAKDFAAVERTEAWRFLQEHDPCLELDILQSLHDAHLRQKRRRRKREEQRVYTELSEAMDCLQHICTEGCATGHCPDSATCRGLRQLVNHLALCDRKKRHSCGRCKRLWQLLRLHASICVQPDHCQVPLCSQFKQKMDQSNGKDEEEDEKWRLLVKKVVSARIMSCLAKRKRQEGFQDQEQPWLKHNLLE
ncbi:BTB/POZ and TAZ domain-containing protein 2-like isoform X2 [Zingiber officinale]|uniref:BTB/POZ and TAZ domain-containing protein 2-like isoform X2 n=1 Tax=Zingiber officinale TaxID=94328 RepID=UPI001C4B8E90|nr:BTB/POZ and TAZ domain-containing protein 2-like isoform X2 [Zingiber officinale]